MSQARWGRPHWALLIVVVLLLGLVAVKHTAKRQSAAASPATRSPAPGPATGPPPQSEPPSAAVPEAAPAPSPAPASKTAPARTPPPRSAAAKPAQTASSPAAVPEETAKLREPAEPLPGSKFEESLKSGRPTVADFGAGWCKACKLMDPVLKIAAVKYEGKVNVLFINTDEYGPLAKQHRVAAIPTQIFFDTKGKEVGRHVGYYPIEDLDAQLRSLGLTK